MSYAVRYLHFISILLVYAAVFAEFIMLSRTLSRKKLSFLAKIDGVYGIASIFVVGAGMAMWFGFDAGLGFKPIAWYMENPIFHLKYGLFIVVGILSIWPSIFFMRQRKGDQKEEIQIPMMRGMSLPIRRKNWGGFLQKLLLTFYMWSGFLISISNDFFVAANS